LINPLQKKKIASVSEKMKKSAKRWREWALLAEAAVPVA
jgi:hypothetical protein